MTSSFKRYSVALLGATMLSSSLMSFDAQAQSGTTGGMIDEITVTARLREENILDVPITETVFGEQVIQDARIDQVGGFINLTPNVTIAQSQSAGISFLTIRGITQVRNGEPPVATVVDGVLQINSRQFTQEMLDIDSIEVVKGPQGAIYGRNATGGAIIINTKKPTNEFEGHIRLGTGKGDEFLAEGSLSGPIVKDKLLFRASIRYRDFDGVLDNVFLNKKVDFTEDIVGRGRLLWNITDTLTADFRVSISRTDGNSLNFVYQPALYKPDGVFLIDPFSFASFDFTVNDADLVDRTFQANNLGFGERDIDEYTLKLDWDMGWAVLTSITSYNDVFEDSRGDQFPYTADLSTLFGGGTQTQLVDIQAWSEEVRVTSPGDQRLRWQVGAYFLGTDRFISSTTGLDTGSGILQVVDRPLTNPLNPTLSFFADDNDNFAWAVFGNFAYDIRDDLEFAFAARYDKDRRKQIVSPFNSAGSPGAVNRATFDAFQPKVSLRYRATDELSLYASWGKGFRSGQFNQNGVGAAAALAGILGVSDVVSEEITRTVEAGFKATFLDGRVRANGAFFRTKLENQQYFVFIGGVGAQVLVPIDEVELLGGEFDVTATLMDGLDVYLAAGVTDSEIKAYALNPLDIGNVSPYVPDYTINIGGQYRKELFPKLGGFVRVDYERRGRQYWDPENSTSRSQLDLLNVRFGVEDPEGRWTLVSTFENITDEVYNSEFVLGGFAHPAPPRLWHVDLRVNF